MGTTLAAGTPGLLVNGSIKPFDIAQMDSLVISIPDSSAAHPELRVWAYGWKAGLPNPVDFHWTLRTRFEDRFRQGEVRISLAAGAMVAMGVIKAPQAAVRRDSARAQLAMTGLPTYFNDSALLDVRSTSAWFRGFFDQEGSVGLRLAPDAQGTVRWTQGGSWIQEPQPIWRQAGWETSWLPEPANPGTAAYRNGNDRIGPKAPARDRHAGHAGHAGQAGQAGQAGSGTASGWTWKFRMIDGRLQVTRP